VKNFVTSPLPNVFGAPMTLGMRKPSGIGLRLREARTVAAVSARELDRLADTTEGHTSLIESGVVQNANAETLAKLAAVLGVSLDWLVTGSGPPPSSRVVRAAIIAARNASASSAA